MILQDFKVTTGNKKLLRTI